MSTQKTVDFLSLSVANYDLSSTADFIFSEIISGKQIVHGCINAALTVLIKEDPEFLKCLQKADVISADGQAVVWASKLLGNPLPSRVPGPDLMEKMIQIAVENNFRIYLFGAEQPIVEMVANIYKKKYGDNLVAGFRNGFYKREESSEIATEINSSKADFLFVATPSPNKEYFNQEYRASMPNVRLLMGVGGTFDVISGKVKRAPAWMQNNGLEWLYRLSKEPRRLWKRYLIGNSKFILIIIREYFRKLSNNKS